MAMTSTPRRLFCFGLGYSAGVLAKRLAAEGWSIAGTCRDPAHARPLLAEGIDAVVFDGDTPPVEPEIILSGATHLLISAPPDEDGDPVLRHFGKAIQARQDLSWIGYLSTTGVYGNTDGRMVDEAAPIGPNVARSSRRALAERDWLSMHQDHGLPIHIFRLAGIYGPGRNALEQLRRGKARRIDKPGHKFSRIHVADIANVLIASIAQPNPGAIYNVCDNEAIEASRVTEFAADLLGVEPPPLLSFAQAAKTMSPMGLSFWKDNRLVDNTRIRSELGVVLDYPDYRTGLTALFSELN